MAPRHKATPGVESSVPRAGLTRLRVQGRDAAWQTEASAGGLRCSIRSTDPSESLGVRRPRPSSDTFALEIRVQGHVVE